MCSFQDEMGLNAVWELMRPGCLGKWCHAEEMLWFIHSSSYIRPFIEVFTHRTNIYWKLMPRCQAFCQSQERAEKSEKIPGKSWFDTRILFTTIGSLIRPLFPVITILLLLQWRVHSAFLLNIPFTVFIPFSEVFFFRFFFIVNMFLSQFLICLWFSFYALKIRSQIYIYIFIMKSFT